MEKREREREINKERLILNGRVKQTQRKRERELKMFYILIQFWHNLG